ncbi:MAG: hypothetical protein FD177_2525 [Desulfovibrionaceae bacterium]|nr:MAG: hypothetical protein FD177_2525 [Desulfovibrionaceae bacterium]
MSRILLAAALLAVFCITAPTGAAMAQQKITSSELEQLKNKVETQRDAYYRLETAEQEARDEGASERAAAFATAKTKAHEQYNRYNAELKKAQAQKAEQDKRAAQDNPDYK